MPVKIELAKKTLKYRRVEEKLLELFKQGKLTGTVHTSIGQEIVPVLLQQYLRDDDYKFSNHRGHSHYMAATNDIEGLIKELLGKIEGCSGGYGGSQHLFNKKHNFYSNGIQGGMTPIATGVAMGLKARNNGEIACVYIGDGTLGQGILYEAINICGIFELPVLFVCEDNGIAQSTLTSNFKLDWLGDRIQGFSCEYRSGNSDDWDGLDKVFNDAVALVRKNKPVFLRIKTRRLMSHSKGDDNRPESWIDDNFINDPLAKLLFADLQLQEYDAIIIKDLDILVEKCIEAEDFIDPNIYSYVQIKDYSLRENEQTGQTVRKKIYKALELILEDGGYVIGEDVRNRSGELDKDYGGAFKVTSNLSDKYTDRVLNTPISEQALIGVATGLSLMGQMSCVEVMFGDFMTLTVDQVYQHISKFSVMYGTSVDLPILIRSPMGGRRGYGPTHSQSIERLFLGVPGVYVSSVNKYSPISELVDEISCNKVPHLMFEHKLNYSSSDVSAIGERYSVFITDDFSKTVIITPKIEYPKLTILTYGYGLDLVENLIAETGVSVEVICPTVISPLNLLPLVKSLTKTGKLFILEEGSDYFGLSSAVVLELTKYRLSFELIGSYGNGSIIPSAYNAEIKLLNVGLEKLEEYIRYV